MKIYIPSNLGDIRLTQYQKFLRVTENLEDSELINRYAVAIFCNISDDVVRSMTSQTYRDILDQIKKVLESISDELPLKRIIKYQGSSYGFIPNLDKLTVGEMADIDSMIHDWQKMDKVMAILYRRLEHKQGDKYLIEKYNNLGVSLDIPLDVALGAYFFLSNLLQDLLTCIPSYIKEMVEQKESRELLEENGVGINQFTESLEGICLNLRTLLK